MLSRLFVLLTFFCVVFAEYHIQHRVSCKKKKLCNGNLMCAYVCEKGTVEVDPWIDASLRYQSALQRQDKMVFYEIPGTHNSAVNEADGYGIEKYFISALYNGKNYDQGDDVGEGVCQFLSLTDQLRMGVRHLEVDIWWGPIEHQVVVCHSPVPLYPVGNITRTAEDRGIPLEWDPKKMSCLGTKRTLRDVLTEIRDWMVLPENQNEIVMIYYDTKWRLSPDQVAQANKLMTSIFGNMIYKVEDGNPLLKYSPNDLLSRGKRIIFENQKDDWANSSTGNAADQIVFFPALWNAHQFSYGEMTEFPDCVVEGDNDWYGKTWVRALDGSFTEAGTRCGVQVSSGDYTNPDDMKFFIWSWDLEEPRLADGCTALMPNGRWATLDCATNLPYACVTTESATNGDYKNWLVDLNNAGPAEKASCPSGYVFAAPHNGYANGLLVNTGLGQTIWLNAPNPLNKNQKQ